MTEAARVCRICGVRKARRYCPGVSGEICSICCGTEREVTVSCPLECEYLQEARRREPEPDVDPRSFPNSDIQVDEAFLQRTEPLLILIAAQVARTALDTQGAVDGDVKESLASLVKTYRTLHSGLIYDSRPENPLAGRIYSAVQETVADVHKRLEQHGGVRDADVLGVLAFLQRLEIQHNNSRPKGRAFIDFLRQFFPPEHPKESGNLILTP